MTSLVKQAKISGRLVSKIDVKDAVGWVGVPPRPALLLRSNELSFACTVE